METIEPIETIKTNETVETIVQEKEKKPIKRSPNYNNYCLKYYRDRIDNDAEYKERLRKQSNERYRKKREAQGFVVGENYKKRTVVIT
jgi:hypothetical protein